MGSKEKGTRYERELLHMFYDNGFMPVRIAGSGSVSIPSVDLLVGKKGLVFAIECKSVRGKSKYVEKEKIEQLKFFADMFGATPLLGIRFDRIGWFFMNMKHLKDTGNGFSVNLELANEKGIKFEHLLDMGNEKS